MSLLEQDHQEDPIIHGLAATGALLKNEREKRNISREEVAATLRLNVSTVIALEEANLDKLPPATFVYGYVRSFGRLVGIDEEIIDNLDLSELDPGERVKPTFRKKRESDIRSLPMRMTTWAIITLLVVLFATWVKTNYFSSAEYPTSPIGDLSTESTQRVNPSPSSIQPHTEMETDSPEDITDSAKESENSIYEETSHSDNAIVVEDSVSTSELSTDELTVDESSMTEGGQVTPVEDETPTEQSLVEETTTDIASTTEETIAGTSRLQINFSAECWTVVRDANGKRHLFGIYKEGEEKIVDGPAPFSVLLGVAQAASVSFNDTPFDHTPYSSKGMARFQLGSSEDNR